MKQLQITNQFLQNVYIDFVIRCEEIERYIAFVDILDNGNHNVLSQIQTNTHLPFTYMIDRELHKTLRASTYLLIYNILESTMSDALDSVHETLVSENVDYMMLNDNLKNIILSNIRKGLSEQSIRDILISNIDIRAIFLSHGYNKKDLLNGNLDVRVVKEFAVRYGFSIDPVDKKAGVYKPEVIREIKDQRNALAHGAISFEQCGHGIPIFTLKNKFENAKKLLLAVFNGLDDLLSQKKYLKTA